MKFSLNKWILLLFAVLIPLIAEGQKPKKNLLGKEKGRKVVTMKASPKATEAQKKADKVKKRQKKAYEKARRKEIKRRYKMQCKGTQARMKQTKKEAMRFNKGTVKSFFSKLFPAKGKHKKKKNKKK